MSVFSAIKAIYSSEWLIAESKQPSLSLLADKYLSKDLQDMTPKEFKATFELGSRYLGDGRQSYASEPYLLDSGILLMPINGVLFKTDFCGSPGTATIAQWYEQAGADPAVKGIVEVVDSPGGQAEGTAFLAQVKAKVNTTKPIVEFVNEMMCSAAYWVGAKSNYIYVAVPTAIIGSIGTKLTYQKSVKDPNVVEIYPKTSSLKNNIFREADKGNIEPMTEHAAYLDSVFMQDMKASRQNISEQALLGQELFSSDAIANGLADEMGTLDDAIAKCIELADATTSTKSIQTIKTYNQMQFNELQLGATLATLGVSVANETGAKSAEVILSDISGKFTEQATLIKTLTSEKANALAELQVAKAEKVTLEATIAELNAKVAKTPVTVPATAQLLAGDQTQAQQEDEFPSFKWLRENNLK